MFIPGIAGTRTSSGTDRTPLIDLVVDEAVFYWYIGNRSPEDLKALSYGLGVMVVPRHLAWGMIMSS